MDRGFFPFFLLFLPNRLYRMKNIYKRAGNHKIALLGFVLLTVVCSRQAMAQTGCLNNRFTAVLASGVTTSSVEYGSGRNALNQQVKLFVDIYEPQRDSLSNRPLVLFAHDGGFVVGSKGQANVRHICTELARRGYVAGSVQYRLSQEILLNLNATEVTKASLRALQDCKAAVRYFRANAALHNIDTNQIFFGGLSAGAVTALHMGYLKTRAQFQAFGDTTTLLDANGGLEGGGGNGSFRSDVQGVINLSGAIGTADWITPGSVPVISMHGTADSAAPYFQGTVSIGVPVPGLFLDGSYVIDTTARARGVRSSFYSFVGAGHIPCTQPDGTIDSAYMDTTIRFISDTLATWLNCSRFVVGVSPRRDDLGLTLGPNPGTESTVVRWKAGRVALLEVYSPAGVRVYEQRISTLEAEHSLPLHNWPAGIYHLKATSPQGTSYALPLWVLGN
jgi:dienelactone hydrolase